ncbi:MAG: hypothetical protein N2545_09000, partial [Thermoflexales bacterium]|nr:hypothetical protein [Thermoflexales bacterium]
MIATLQTEAATHTRAVAIGKGIAIGGDAVVLMVGPCAVEDEAQLRAIAEAMVAHGLRVMRGGAFKPRTSPYAFQGLGLEGLKLLRRIADEYDLLVVTEALGVEH